MRRLRLRVRLLTGAIGAAAVVVALAVPSYAAATPGWRIVKVLKYCGFGSLEGVTATGPDDAWAVGEPGAGLCQADVEHWNGAYWKRVPVPSGVSVGAELVAQSTPIAASSASDAWIFPDLLDKKLVDYNDALRWNGKSWQRFTLPGNPIITSAVALDSHQVWAFGYVENKTFEQLPYAARYGGRAWRKLTLPGAPVSVSSLGPDDMWAVGPTLRTADAAKQVFIAMQWTGRRWRTLRLPAAMLDVGKGDSASLGVAAVGPGQAWFSYVIQNGRGGTLRAGLLYLNGTRWQQVKAPAAIREIDAVSQDGNGGVWLLADVGIELNQYWYHYAGGRWTRVLVPTPRYYNDTMFAMARVPGTTSMWSVGEADGDSIDASEGVITRYGS